MLVTRDALANDESEAVMARPSNFCIRAAVALILAVAITAATIVAAPTGVLDQATAAAGLAGEVLTGEDDGAADEQAGVRARCWIWCL